MTPSARLINTSRGQIVDEAALIAGLSDCTIAGAALDVFDQEPLSPDHPFRAMPNALANLHIGNIATKIFQIYYGDTVDSIAAWLDARQ